MEKFSSVNEVLDFAINAEQEAIDFYQNLADKTSNSDMKQAYMDFVNEEIQHKARLLNVKETGILEKAGTKVVDLKVSDYLVPVKISDNMTYADALVVAMKKEKAAFKLYLTLSTRTDCKELKDLFLMLAQEESKHKLKFEIEYDEFILREN
jgi:rubrerythrin